MPSLVARTGTEGGITLVAVFLPLFGATFFLGNMNLKLYCFNSMFCASINIRESVAKATLVSLGNFSNDFHLNKNN